jgi:hypothetical protein
MGLTQFLFGSNYSKEQVEEGMQIMQMYKRDNKMITEESPAFGRKKFDDGSSSSGSSRRTSTSNKVEIVKL